MSVSTCVCAVMHEHAYFLGNTTRRVDVYAQVCVSASYLCVFLSTICAVYNCASLHYEGFICVIMYYCVYRSICEDKWDAYMETYKVCEFYCCLEGRAWVRGDDLKQYVLYLLYDASDYQESNH